MASSRFSKKDSVIYLNSEETSQMLLKLKLGYEGESSLVDFHTKELIRKPKVFFKQVSRRLNMRADDLAKQGKDRNSLIQGGFVYIGLVVGL